MMPRKTFTAIALTLGIAAPAAAQDVQLDGCSVGPEDYAELVAPMVAGTWNVMNGTGIVVGPGGFARELAPEPGEPITITLEADGTLRGTSGPMQNMTVEFVEHREGDQFGIPVLNLPGHEQRIDFDAVGRDIDCDSALLPLIEISGGIVTQDGTISFQAPLHFIDENTMSGVFLMNVAGLHGRRLFTLSR